MNTGISKNVRDLKRAGAIALACISIAGCSGQGAGFSFAQLGLDRDGQLVGPVVPKTRRTKMADGTVSLRAPRGYCIDKTSVSGGLKASSALIANCSALDGRGAARSDAAVMTVAVSARRADGAPMPNADDLAAMFAPEDVLRKQQKGNLGIVHLKTGGDSTMKPADPKHWRAATILDNRVIMLAVYAPKGAVMAGERGGALIVSLARGLSATQGGLFGLRGKSSAPAKGDPMPVAKRSDNASEDTAIQEIAKEPKKGLRNVIGRLFNRS